MLTFHLTLMCIRQLGREGGGVAGQVAGNLEGLSIKQTNVIKAILGLSCIDSSAATGPSRVLSARQLALDERLDRVLRDVVIKSTDLARFRKLDYKPPNEMTVEKYHLWSRRFKDQLEEHGLGHLLYSNFSDMYSDIMISPRMMTCLMSNLP